MDKLVFFGNDINREISISNVKSIYTSIKLNGYLPDVSKVEYLTGEVIKDQKLVCFEIVPKNEKNPISISNFDIKFESVDYSEDLKGVVDGQHKSIAMELLKLTDDLVFDDSSIYREVNLPKKLSISEFVAMKNIGKPWTISDFDKTDIPSGNPFIDQINTIGKDEGLQPQFAYDIYTLNTGALKASTVKSLRAKTGTLPKSIKLDETSISDGHEVLNALKESSFLTKDLYNNTRFSKGLKQFVKESKISISDLCRLINKIDKKSWEQYFTAETGTSAEAQLYKSGFTELNKFLFE